MTDYKKLIPEDILWSINHYVLEGLDPGNFLNAVLSNDLLSAIQYGDEESLRVLPNIIKYLYNKVPLSLWRDKANVRYHLWNWEENLKHLKEDGVVLKLEE